MRYNVSYYGDGAIEKHTAEADTPGDAILTVAMDNQPRFDPEHWAPEHTGDVTLLTLRRNHRYFFMVTTQQPREAA